MNAVGHPYAGARTTVGGTEIIRVLDVTALPDLPFEIRDAGKIWSANATTIGTGFLPKIAVDEGTGTVAVAYYSTSFAVPGSPVSGDPDRVGGDDQVGRLHRGASSSRLPVRLWVTFPTGEVQTRPSLRGIIPFAQR